MKPPNLKTKIFLDGGDQQETKEVISLLGFLDGQTTNPTLISKNPQIQEQIAAGEKLTSAEVIDFYKRVVGEISSLIPQGSVSIEVYADYSTTAEEMLAQGKEMFEWIPSAHIKLPITKEGLKAAEEGIKLGLRLNLTLCFTQEQAAAVYAATRGAKKGDVFVSPFVGRLDDRGENGMDLIKNITQMYQSGDGHVEVLSASVRNLDHFLYAIALGADIITAPYKVLKEWAEKDLMIPRAAFIPPPEYHGRESVVGGFSYERPDLKPISYEEIELEKNWHEYDIYHELTDKGIERFADDWNTLIQ